MANFGMNAIEEKYESKTVLAISPRIVNQLTAEKLAREEMVQVGARLPQPMFIIRCIGFQKNCKDTQSELTWCGECMITLSLPRSGACNLAILNCAPVFAPRLLRCACGLVMQYCKVFF